METTKINILTANDNELLKISKENLLALNLEEMKSIKKYFNSLGRNPTDVEIETIAQTWSEHCKHKTLKGEIEFKFITALKGWTKKYNNLLKETIFKATRKLNKSWTISVFQDNAGIIEFDRNYGIAFKVETHNHPSALEPYGGAATGIGGVIRDILGVGLGGKPIANTDVFCFGPLDYQYENLPKGVLHPKRIFKGVVCGVRDYGNRMGIPTVNGAIIFDEGYLCNPLVYCGTVGIIPKNKCFKSVKPGYLILSVGGRTGRDGIHGATFSSETLDKDTPLSPVQIGNPIVEKKILDVILQARDKNLYTAITDCGGGGYSSAIGELAAKVGARIYLDRVKLKYEGLKPWEIWLSESQERMILAVKRSNLKKILKIFESEDVEAQVIGEFTNDKKLTLYYRNKIVCEIDMDFLHNGLPKSKKIAYFEKTKYPEPTGDLFKNLTLGETLKKLLSSPTIASKEIVIRQYDHEVQGQTVIKPLHGKFNGPGDAAVIWPFAFDTQKPIKTYKGVVISCGINQNYGKIDPYWMAYACVEEALRNAICVGGDLNRTAILDNFCWPRPDKPEQLGSLVLAAQACHDASLAFGTPFVSGKDSLNNEFVDETGKSFPIPGTLLISAISITKDIRKTVTMDFKLPESLIYVIGETKDELGGSELYKMFNFLGNSVPEVESKKSKKVMKRLANAIKSNIINSCHDCSEGGLLVAISEMCFAGGLGAEIYLKKVPFNLINNTIIRKDFIVSFSESTGRFIVEVSGKNKKRFEKIMKGTKFSIIGKVKDTRNLIVYGLDDKVIMNENVDVLRDCWNPLLW